MKNDNINLTCRQCSREFIFTKAEQEFYKEKAFSLPRRCKECRSNEQSHSHHAVCCRCGSELEEGIPVYCATCLANVELEFELKMQKVQKATNEAHAKLKATQSEEAELQESLRRKEQILRQSEQKVKDLEHDLEEMHQLYGALNKWFQPTLNGVEERITKRLEALEHRQNKINESIIQTFQKIRDQYEDNTLLESIKRSLRGYRKQAT